jgi:2-polyprenyl-3-methyl-5-hydroxy-6-metoxy-1,4-benzoquinol methylase
MTTSFSYDEYYYSHDCGRPYQRDESWLTFFDQIAKRIIEQFEPKTVLDAGCAWGFLVEAFRNHGVEAFGVDISKYAIQNVHPDIKPYCWIGSITEPFPNKYDLITCIEVLEHLPQKEAEKQLRIYAPTQTRLFFLNPI